MWSSYLLCVGFPTISTLSTLITIKKLSQCHSFNMFTWDFIGWQCQMQCWILLFTIGWMLGMWYFKYLLVFLIGQSYYSVFHVKMPSRIVHNLADVKNIIFFINIKLFRRLFNELMVGYFCTFFLPKVAINWKVSSLTRLLFNYLLKQSLHLIRKLCFTI